MAFNEPMYDSVIMRELGQSYLDKGFFEINLSSGAIEWVNEFVLNKHGMTLEQIKVMTIHDLIPHEYHEALNNSISDESNGKSQKFSVWPQKSADGRLVWWYILKAKSGHPLHWYKAEYLNTTGNSGSEYANMLAAMNTANSYNDLASKFSDHGSWVKGEIKRIDGDADDLRQGQTEIREQLNRCLKAVNRAVDETLSINKKMGDLKTNIEDQFSKQTTAILNLMNTDTMHDQRMASFETHMKRAASDASTEAVQQISASAEKAGKAITVQANKAGQGLAKRVTIPVSAIAAIATIIQWLIQHFMK